MREEVCRTSERCCICLRRVSVLQYSGVDLVGPSLLGGVDVPCREDVHEDALVENRRDGLSPFNRRSTWHAHLRVRREELGDARARVERVDVCEELVLVNPGPSRRLSSGWSHTRRVARRCLRLFARA